MKQNPEFHVEYEFPNEEAAEAAREFLREKRITNIEVVVRRSK
jgi:hypothetical protein